MTRPVHEKHSRRRDWILLAVLVGAGALLRGVYLSELVHAPDYDQPVVDAQTHDYWARSLSTGDWRPPAGLPDPQIRTTPFFRPPGYPYFLAAIYALTGGSYLAPRLVQMFLGLCSVVLVFLLGRRWFGRGAAPLAAAGMSFSWIFIYFEGELQALALLLPVLLSAMMLLMHWYDSRRSQMLVLASALMGTACLVRPNVLALLPFLLAWIAWANSRRPLQGRPSPQSAWRLVAAGLLPALLIVSVATIRNVRVSGEWVLISANGGINLYIGNNPQADGYVADELPGIGRFGTCFDQVNIVRSLERTLQRPMSHSQVSDWFATEARRYILENPGRTLALLWKKACLLWGNPEVGHNKELYYERSHSRVLRLLPGPFAVLASLALLGAILLWRARPRDNRAVLLLLGGFIVVMMLAILPFFVAGRYRVPVLPVLLLFAGYACQDTFRRFQQRQWNGVAAIVGAFLVLLLIQMNLPYRHQASLGHWHYTRGIAWLAAEQFDLAETAFAAALEKEPGRYQARHNLASLLARRGDTAGAVEHWETVIKMRPEEAPGLAGLGAALLVLERPQEALPYLQGAVTLEPTVAEFHGNLARAFQMLGEGERALQEMRQAAMLDATDPEGWRTLAAMAQAMGNTPVALEGWQQAMQIQADPYLANNIAWVMATHTQAELRNGLQAVRLAKSACEATDYKIGALLNTLAAAQAETGQFAEAVATSRRSLNLAEAAQDDASIKKIQTRIQAYEEHLPYRDETLR